MTLFFGQIFYVLVTQGYRVSFLGLNNDLGLKPNWDLTGGPNGIANVDRFRVFGAHGVAATAPTTTSRSSRSSSSSPPSRSRTALARAARWRALKDDALAAQAMSMPINRLKLMAVGVGAAIAALAGTINAALLQGAFPENYNTQV